MDDAFPLSDIDEILPGLIEGKNKLYYGMGANLDFDHQVIGWIKSLSGNQMRGSQPPGELIQLGHHLHELRMHKSAAEIALISKACQITGQAHVEAMRKVQPGWHEYQLQAELEYQFLSGGASGPAYPSIVAGGKNACTLHYISNRNKLMGGDLVLVDAGCEYEGYASDVSRTYPVNGQFTPAQKDLYEVVLAAQLAAIDAIKPGAQWNQIHDSAVQVIADGLRSLGLVSGSLDEILTNETYRRFFMHKTGHWLGLDVHDVGEYQIDQMWRVLEPGMVMTVEPGIYIPEASDVPLEFQCVGLRIEDTVAVTRQGVNVLSDDVPKTVAAIESVMAVAADV